MASVYVGWDVGGWNCDKNANSRDAIAILDAEMRLVGRTWRGNLRRSMEAESSEEWIRRLFDLCGTAAPPGLRSVTIAIDTPLGFPEALLSLAAFRKACAPAVSSDQNQYLFRKTERTLALRGWTPLSSVKDMIGSQATKAMHALARFTPKVESCGVWTDGSLLRAIETYPAVCRDAPSIRALKAAFPVQPHDDMDDAIVCALIAAKFATERDTLEPPGADVASAEGWIWAPRGHDGPGKSPKRAREV